MPNRREFDTISSQNFRVEIEGVTQGPFIAVDVLEAETAVIESRSGNDPIVRKTPGRHHYANIVLRRAFTNTTELWDWRKMVLDGQIERKAGSIVLLDSRASQSGGEIMRYNFFEAWPCRYRIGPWDANSDAALVEEIEIVVEKIERG